MSLPIYVSDHSDPTDRGHAFGATHRDGIQRTWAGYRAFFEAHDISEQTTREVALCALDAVQEWAPVLATEILAIGAASGLEEWEIAALNARSEVLATFREPMPGECSTSVALVPDAPPRTIQTWDWNFRMDQVKVGWRLRTPSGRKVATITEFGILAKIGVNDAGLGLHFNLLQHQADGGLGGVPVHVISRWILEQATTLDEVEALLATVKVTASASFTVATWRDGMSDAATFEVAPPGIARVNPNTAGFVWRTNHFLSPGLAEGERLVPVDADTVARLRSLEVRANGLSHADLDDRAAAMVLHREDGAALCCHPDADPQIADTARWETLLTVGIDLENHGLLLQEATPCAVQAGEWVRL